MPPNAPRPTGRHRKVLFFSSHSLSHIRPLCHFSFPSFFQRLTRMDAAVDGMRSYGFSDGLIVSTVKGLLEVGFVLLLMFSLC